MDGGARNDLGQEDIPLRLGQFQTFFKPLDAFKTQHNREIRTRKGFEIAHSHRSKNQLIH
jgi:hypothetical protein